MDSEERYRLAVLSKITASKLSDQERAELARLTVQKEEEKEKEQEQILAKRNADQEEILVQLRGLVARLEKVPHDLPFDELEFDIPIEDGPDFSSLSRGLAQTQRIASRVAEILARSVRSYGKRAMIYQRALAAWRETDMEAPQWALEVSLARALEKAGLYRELVGKMEEQKILRDVARNAWDRVLLYERLLSRQVTIRQAEGELIGSGRHGEPDEVMVAAVSGKVDNWEDMV